MFDPSGSLTGGSRSKNPSILARLGELCDAEGALREEKMALEKVKQEMEKIKTEAIK